MSFSVFDTFESFGHRGLQEKVYNEETLFDKIHQKTQQKEEFVKKDVPPGLPYNHPDVIYNERVEDQKRDWMISKADNIEDHIQKERQEPHRYEMFSNQENYRNLPYPKQTLSINHNYLLMIISVLVFIVGYMQGFNSGISFVNSLKK